MTAVQVLERMTAEEYLRIPEDWRGRRTQLIDGEIVVTEAGWPHQSLCVDLVFALETWKRAGTARGKCMLPLDVQIDHYNVFGPDLLWYAEGRLIGDRRPSPIPDIAVEVRSPSTWRYDVGAKKSRYESAGLPELWLVDTDAKVILIFRRSTPKSATFDVAVELAIGDTLTSPQLPGFELALAELFAAAT